MEPKSFTMEDGSVKQFTKKNGKWIPFTGETEIEKQRRLIAEDVGPMEALLIGAGKKTNDLIENTKQLLGFGEGAEEDEGGYAALKEASPYATGGGEVLGELAQLVIPGGAALKGTRLAKIAMKHPKITAALTDLTTSAGMAGLRQEGDLGERASAAGEDALASILGMGAGKVLSEGIGVTKAARGMMDKGVKLTPEQALGGPAGYVADRIGPLIEHTPLLARGAQAARKTGEETWHKAPLQEAALPGQKITKGGHEGFNQVKEGYTKAYTEAWKGLTELPPSMFANTVKKIKKLKNSLDRADSAVLGRIHSELARFAKLRNKGIGSAGRQANAIDRLIQKSLNSASSRGKANLVEALEVVKKVYRRNIPNNVRGKLAAVDKHYPKLLTVQKATGKALAKGGRFTPNQLISSARTVGGEAAAASGRVPMRGAIDDAMSTIAKDRPNANAFISTLAKLTGIIPEAGLRMAGNPMIGQNILQRGARAAPQGLKDIMSGARVGAAINDEDEDDLMKLLNSLTGG